MRKSIFAAAIAALAFGAAQASAQTATLNFEDGTDQGFGHKFSNDASESFPIVNIGGSNRMGVLRDGDYQEADRGSGNPADPFLIALKAAALSEGTFNLSYDYYINTAGGNQGTFLQLKTYIGTSTGYIEGTSNDVSINGTQLASGGILSGTSSSTFAARGYALPDTETFFRLGFIVNGNSATGALTVYYDNITISPVVPEPTSIAALGAAGVLGLGRRRRA